jgi:hypothetical protein
VTRGMASGISREGRRGGLPLRDRCIDRKDFKWVKGGAARRPPPTTEAARVGNEGRRGGPPLRSLQARVATRCLEVKGEAAHRPPPTTKFFKSQI